MISGLLHSIITFITDNHFPLLVILDDSLKSYTFTGQAHLNDNSSTQAETGFRFTQIKVSLVQIKKHLTFVKVCVNKQIYSM